MVVIQPKLLLAFSGVEYLDFSLRMHHSPKYNGSMSLCLSHPILCHETRGM